MSGDAMKWLLSLEDKLSGPASSATKKLEQLEQRMERLRKASAVATDPALQKKLGAKLGGLGVEKVEAMGMVAAEKHAGGWVETLDHGLGLVEKIGTAALKVGEKIADWTKEAIKLAGEKELDFISFKQMLGDGEKAKALMESVEQAAEKMTFSDDQARGLAKSLVAGGFSSDDIPTFLRGLNDAAAATGASFEKVEGAVAAMRRMNSEGKVSEKTMRALTGAGIPIGEVYKNIAEEMHITAAAAHELVKSGGVSSNLAVFAAMKASRDVRSGGVMGTAGESAVNESSVELMKKISQKWEDNFANLWDSKGFEKWKGFLRNLDSGLSSTSESGRRLSESITGAFDHLLAGVFGEVSGPNGLKGVDDLVLKLAGGIEKAGIAVGSLADGFVGQLNPALKSFGVLNDEKMDPEKIKIMSAKFKEFGETIGKLATDVAYLAGVLADLAGLGMKIAKWTPAGLAYQFWDKAAKVAGSGSLGRMASDVLDTETPNPNAVDPVAWKASQLSGSMVRSINGEVHQVINIAAGGAVDPKAIGDAAKQGQRAALEEHHEDVAMSLGVMGARIH